MKIKIDDLSGVEVSELLTEHLRALVPHSPPQSRHALDLKALREPEITFWSAWEGDELLGCVALKVLDSQHAEIKSMRTAASHLRKGVAKRLLQHIVVQARERRVQRLSLETGSMEYFEPARRLYQNFGFNYCEPFAEYIEDPHSVFMTKEL